MRSPDPLAAIGGHFYGEGRKGREKREGGEEGREGDRKGGGLLIREGRERSGGATSKRDGREERGDGKGGEKIPPPKKKSR